MYPPRTPQRFVLVRGARDCSVSFEYGEHMTTRDPGSDDPRDDGSTPRPMTARDLLDSELVGMWADRDDIGDSSEYARTLRERAWQSPQR